MAVEVAVEVAGDWPGAACWVHDVVWWGLCGKGEDEASAIADLRERAFPDYRSFLERHGGWCPDLGDLEVAERVRGDEQAFARDRRAVAETEVERTLEILGWARGELRRFLAETSDAVLDWDDSERVLPEWAWWRTLRQMAWHVVDTESRYYLPAIGVAPLPRGDDLLEELERSHAHVRATVPSLERAAVVESEGEVWTTRKLLRRLAWHEHSELYAMRQLRARARRVLGDA